MCRALLLSAYTADEQRQAATAVVRDVARTVTDILGPLINLSILDTFRTELLELFHDAMMIWWRAQYSMIQIYATIEDTEDERWGRLSDDGDESAAESQAQLPPPRAFIMLVLFPRILIVRKEDGDDDDDDDDVAFGGIGFWNSQAATAAEELREDTAARRPKRVTSRRDRRMTNGKSSIPTSPIKLKGPSF